MKFLKKILDNLLHRLEKKLTVNSDSFEVNSNYGGCQLIDFYRADRDWIAFMIKVEKMVENFKKENGYNKNKPLIDFVQEKLHFKVIYKKNMDSDSGMLIDPQNNIRHIFLNTRIVDVEYYKPSNFILARLLGYYFLHSEQGLKYFKKSANNVSEDQFSEDQCGESILFAAAFLMPLKDLDDCLNKHFSILRMAMRYGVRPRSVEVRLLYRTYMKRHKNGKIAPNVN